MAVFNPEWVAHQQRRFTRPDARRFMRPDVVPSPRASAPGAPSPRIEAERAELLALKALVADVRFTLALWRLVRKYRPDQPRDEQGRWVDEGGGSRPRAALAGMPRIPRQRPSNPRERTAIAKEMARWIAEKGLAAADFISKSSWLYHAMPYISSYMDAPKSLEELQQDALSPKAGYDIHHIVERSSAFQAGYPQFKIDGPDNLVRIPTMKHWEINAWYQRANNNFGGMSPREYLRYQDWDERERVGLDALQLFGILKP